MKAPKRKALKKVPEREYRYRLYSTPRVNCGPEVAEFITEHSGGVIQVDFQGELELEWSGEPPFTVEEVSMAARSDMLFPEPTIILEDSTDTEEILFGQNFFTIVSRMALLKLGDNVATLPAFIYFTTAAIINRELSNYLPDRFPRPLPQKGLPGWSIPIGAGIFPFDVSDTLQKTRKDYIELNEFLNVVEGVFRAVSVDYRSLHARSNPPPDPRQQPPDEVKADFGGPIEWSAGKAEEEQEDQIAQYAEQIGVWIERKGLVVGSEIAEDIQNVLLNSDRNAVIGIVEALIAEQPAAEIALIALIRDCAHPSASNLLETLIAASDTDLAKLAKEALARRNQEQEPPAPIRTKGPGALSEHKWPVDSLGYEVYANALGDLITNPNTETPLVIAICAPWGMGKSTLMKYIERRVKTKNEQKD